jgi:ribonuclease HII
MKQPKYEGLTLEIEETIWTHGYNAIAGIDEAGCGPLAGPVVASGVVFPKHFYHQGIIDSKKLTPSRRDKLFDLIVANALDYGVGIVSQQEVDRINIRQATFLAMKKALGKMKIIPDYLLIDGYEIPGAVIQQEAIVNGDEHCFTIAAASIIAKVSRDRIMTEYHNQYPQYGFNKHKGYGTLFHREMILKYGPCPLHRKTFLHKILDSET